VSRIDARQAHTAGDSWRKWQEPSKQIVHKWEPDPFVYRRPWYPDIALWLLFIFAGALAAVLVS
jgi:hypothetical protein